ncbi:MAG: hypothetical protein MUC80_08820 [Candidatus Thermoplasmatota archaeon]|jgi:hypothetical protein|nr:hypothetical protein [Candidatus Thermoplasmatota archaeon]
MDKKPLLAVSLCAVVLLILSSLTNVVGYQSVKSTTVSDSPLFQTRTQKATNQQRNILTPQYLGKGNEWNIPQSDNRNEQLKKALEFISRMDEKSFTQFTEICIKRIHQDKSLKEISSRSIETSFHILRTNPVAIMNSFSQRNNQTITAYGTITLCVWFPGCIPIFILYLVVSTIISLMKQIIFTYKDLCTDREKIQLMLEEQP